jgi:periplasmic divalent cation tolerance protein
MDNDSKDILLVMVTAANQEEAAKIADQVVRSHQAACATVIPTVLSSYWWQGKMVSEQESMVLIKTTAGKFQSLQDMIKKIHTYEVPEIIAVPVSHGLPQYLAWVRRETN